MNKITFARLQELKSTYPNRPRGWYIRQARADTQEYIGKPNHPKGLTWEEAGIIVKNYFMTNSLRLADPPIEYDDEDDQRIGFARSCDCRQITSLLLARDPKRTYEWRWEYRQVIKMLTPDSWVAWITNSQCPQKAARVAIEDCGKLGITPDDLAKGGTTAQAACFFLDLIGASWYCKQRGLATMFEFSDQTFDAIIRRVVAMGGRPIYFLKYAPDDLIEGIVANLIKHTTGRFGMGGDLAACIICGGKRLTADQIDRLTAVDPAGVAKRLLQEQQDGFLKDYIST